MMGDEMKDYRRGDRLINSYKNFVSQNMLAAMNKQYKILTRIIPMDIKTIKFVLFYELQSLFDKFSSRRVIVNHWTKWDIMTIKSLNIKTSYLKLINENKIKYNMKIHNYIHKRLNNELLTSNSIIYLYIIYISQAVSSLLFGSASLTN